MIERDILHKIQNALQQGDEKQAEAGRGLYKDFRRRVDEEGLVDLPIKKELSRVSVESTGIDLDLPLIDKLEYKPDKHIVLLNGQERNLPSKLHRLFDHMYNNPNRYLSVQELLDIWGGSSRSRGTLQKGIERLREQVEKDRKRPSRILSIRGKGYIFRDPSRRETIQ